MRKKYLAIAETPNCAKCTLFMRETIPYMRETYLFLHDRNPKSARNSAFYARNLLKKSTENLNLLELVFKSF